MHPAAGDALLYLTALGKESRLSSKTLQSLPSWAPARVVCFHFSNANYNPQGLRPCCSTAWNSLPPDHHQAMPSRH